MHKHLLTLTLCLALVGLSGAVHAGGGSTVEEPAAAESVATPEQIAAERYNAGLGNRDRAWKLTGKLATETDENKRKKLQKKIRGAYETAIEEFRAAIENRPSFHQAHSSLGYAYRQTGRYDMALAAYDEALRLDPAYAQAIEYRAEAYLGLNRINDAQNAYRLLTDKDPKLAADLLGAMRAWIEQHRADPGGVETKTLDGLAAWVDDRQASVAQTSSQRKAWTW